MSVLTDSARHEKWCEKWFFAGFLVGKTHVFLKRVGFKPSE